VQGGVEAVRAGRSATFEGHPDLAHMQTFPVPLVIFGAKWDALATDTDPEKRKSLCKALRGLPAGSVVRLGALLLRGLWDVARAITLCENVGRGWNLQLNMYN